MTRPCRTLHTPLTRLVIALALLLGGALQAGADDADRWEKAIAAFEQWDAKNTPTRDGVLFLGSSSIRMWPTAKDFPILPVVNRGFGGAQISDVNAFARRLTAPYHPSLIVFYCGDNDIKAGKSPERVVADFRAFLRFVHETEPQAHVVYLPIKPSVSRWSLWDPMQEVNAAVRADADVDERLHYVDVATPMLAQDGGMPPADLFIDDGLHLSEKGYEIWNDALRPVLHQLMVR